MKSEPKSPSFDSTANADINATETRVNVPPGNTNSDSTRHPTAKGEIQIKSQVRLHFVQKPEKQTFGAYTALSERPLVRLEPIPRLLHDALSISLLSHRRTTVDGKDIDSAKAAGKWVAYQCCDAMHDRGIWAFLQLARESKVGPDDWQPEGSKSSGSTVLRRHGDKLGLELQPGYIEWTRVSFRHSADCLVSPELEVVPPEEKRTATGKAPPVRRASPSDFGCSQKIRSGKATIRVSGQKLVRKERARQSAQDRMRSSPMRRKLMTVLEDSNLLDMLAHHSLATSQVALAGALNERTADDLPPGLELQETWLLFLPDLMATAGRRLAELQNIWPTGCAPILTAAIMLDRCEPLSVGLRVVHAVSVGGAVDKLFLPKSVKFWTNDARDVRAPFVGLLELQMGEDDKAMIRRGYLHPAYSTECPVPVESNEERGIPETFRSWHSTVAQEHRARVRVSKSEFTIEVHGVYILVDAHVEVLGEDGKWHVLAYIEHLGSKNLEYLARKRKACVLLSPRAKVLYMWDGDCPVSAADIWFETRPIEEQLDQLLATFLSGERSPGNSRK